MADGNILSNFGIDLLEEEIDDVIFQTNEFLTDATFTGAQGPFWWILQMCMALAALFAIIMTAGMAYKMMVKHEPLDIMKLFRPLAVSLVLCWWYPPADTGMAGSGSNWCFLDFLSYIPNCIGSYTHDLYQAEAAQISDKFEEAQELIFVRDTMYTSLQAQADVAHTGTSDPNLIEATMEQTGVDEVTSMEKDAAKLWFTSLTSGIVVGIDKIIMLIALVVFRIGWWATIYCQQILLGMLTIFGPIQWAFSLLPKWEGAWAKWLTRYLTVHFYGAMLYFVGFYVLLLFDIVLCIQVENLTAITASEQTMAAYLQNSFFSAGYLMAASIVALKCLNLVPDLAAWMIPEGDTAFSTRNFGEGVAQQAKMTATGAIGTMSSGRRIWRSSAPPAPSISWTGTPGTSPTRSWTAGHCSAGGGTGYSCCMISASTCTANMPGTPSPAPRWMRRWTPSWPWCGGARTCADREGAPPCPAARRGAGDRRGKVRLTS